MNGSAALARLNQFTVQTIERDGEHVLLFGTLNKPGQPSQGDHMSLFLTLDKQVDGQLVALNPDTRSATLRVPSIDYDPSIAAGAALPICDTFCLQNIKLVLDSPSRWTCRTFQSRDAFEQPGPSGGRMWRAIEPGDADRTDGKIVPGGWDHEHCALCCERIGGGGQLDGYFNSSSNEWLCARCYKRYVQKQNLSFVTGDLDSTDDPNHKDFQRIKELMDEYSLNALRTYIQSGANVNASNPYGETPLMLASSRGHPALISLLLSLGADVNTISPHGYAAVINAAHRGHYDAVKLLLDAGATVDVPSTFCSGSLLTYIKTGHGGEDPRITELLIHAGAK